jgi:hypothetical protein
MACGTVLGNARQPSDWAEVWSARQKAVVTTITPSSSLARHNMASSEVVLPARLKRPRLHRFVFASTAACDSMTASDGWNDGGGAIAAWGRD